MEQKGRYPLHCRANIERQPERHLNLSVHLSSKCMPKEAGGSGQNPRRHGKDIQSLHSPQGFHASNLLPVRPRC